MGIRGGPFHQILYKRNVELIDEGCNGIKWNPPSFTYNGEEIPEEDYVEIHDDLFMRFHDYFAWIETYNPSGPKAFNRGFNYFGLTVIKGENLVKFKRLIDSLINLFENAPENIQLTGSFCFGDLSDAENPDVGYYEKIEVKKDLLMEVFFGLQNITDRAMKSNGYLLHFGI